MGIHIGHTLVLIPRFFFGCPKVRDTPETANVELIGQGVLVQEELELPSGGHVPILKLNDASWEVMHGKRTVQLVQVSRTRKAEKSLAHLISWEGVDRDLFERLRELRRRLAEERGVPPYIIFSDATLRELAQVRPASEEKLRLIYGVGEAKLRDFGTEILQIIERHCQERDLRRDLPPLARVPVPAPKPTVRPNTQREQAYGLFRREASIEAIVQQTGRARSTVHAYLADFISDEKPASIAAWMPEDLYNQIASAARLVGTDRLKPIYIALGERVAYDHIKLVVAHLGSRASKVDATGSQASAK